MEVINSAALLAIEEAFVLVQEKDNNDVLLEILIPVDILEGGISDDAAKTRMYVESYYIGRFIKEQFIYFKKRFSVKDITDKGKTFVPDDPHNYRWQYQMEIVFEVVVGGTA